jgi:hypothetical protein
MLKTCHSDANTICRSRYYLTPQAAWPQRLPLSGPSFHSYTSRSLICSSGYGSSVFRLSGDLRNAGVV